MAHSYWYPVYKLDTKNNIELCFRTNWTNAIELVNFLLVVNENWQETGIVYYPKKTPINANKTP